MSQTNYEQYPEKGIRGLMADSGFRNVLTGANATMDLVPEPDVLTFGHGVIYADGDGVNVRTPATPAGVVAGIATLAQQEAFRTTGLGVANGYLPKDAVNVLTKGRIWVLLDGASPAVSVGDAVYMTALDTRPDGAGGITGVDVGNLLIPTARFMGSAIGGELVIVEINLP